MTCVRVLEILPVLFERLGPSFVGPFGDFKVALQNLMDFKWLHDLMDWGKSQLKVIVVYWKKAIISLLNALKVLRSDSPPLMVVAIENLISSGQCVFIFIFIFMLHSKTNIWDCIWGFGYLYKS